MPTTVPVAEIPIPPSVNHLWRVVRRGYRKIGVVKSKSYAAWLEAAVLLLRVALPVHARYPLRLTVVICKGRGWRKGRDLDNCVKAVADALVRAGRVADDDGDHVGAVSVSFGPDRPDACCLVALEPLTSEPTRCPSTPPPTTATATSHPASPPVTGTPSPP